MSEEEQIKQAVRDLYKRIEKLDKLQVNDSFFISYVALTDIIEDVFSDFFENEKDFKG